MSDVHRHYPEAGPAEIEAIQRGQLLGFATALSAQEMGLALAARIGTLAEIQGEFGIRREDPIDPVVEHSCRNCGAPFMMLQANVGKTSKWFNLCASCLADEI